VYNAAVFRLTVLKVIAFSCIVLLLSACARGDNAAQSTLPAATVTLQRLSTSPAESQTAEGPPPELEATTPPLPSPTPVYYTVVENDTMLGIAERYNLSLDELLAANSDVDPRAMAVGTDLFIPVGEGPEDPATLPTPTAAPLRLGEADCYVTIDSSMWCFAAATNEGVGALENLSAILYLYDANGQLLADYPASAPLNVLAPGQRMPLVVFIEQPPREWAIAQAQLLTSLGVISEERYLEVQLQELEIVFDAERLRAAVQGEVRLADREQRAGVVWVLAVAYDSAKHIVGVRRWEYTQPLAGSEVLPFGVNVFSLGAVIDTVDVLVEARP